MTRANHYLCKSNWANRPYLEGAIASLRIWSRVLSADEALEWGLLTKVVADDALTEEAGKLAAQIANGPTEAYGEVRRLLLGSYETSLETQLELESRGISRCIGTADGREGLASFIERRKPAFKGE